MDKSNINPDKSEFITIERPHIALITNHGYGGVDIPIGGAPDTGGQNVYVNAYALALDQLGYKVTIYARGGFPFYDSEKIRSGEDFLSPNVRYVFVPGGGDDFIRKEDISIALIEQTDWIYHHIQEEASQLNLFPWQYYETINTHYWDAGVLGVSLILKWQNDICSKMIELLISNVVSKNSFNKFHKDRHFHYISKAPRFYLGKLLLEFAGGDSYIYKEEVVLEAFNKWLSESPLATEVETDADMHIDWLNLRSTIAAETIQLRPLILAKVLGTAILDQPVNTSIFDDPTFRNYRSYDELQTYNDVLFTVLNRINRHVWTPHSLGVIKEKNFRYKSKEINRNLRFRERRSQERVICDYTPVFGATSYEIAESLITNYGVDIDDVLFFPPGVDTELFQKYSSKDMNDLYQYLHAETGLDIVQIKSATILFETSRMDATKRKDVIINAFLKVIGRNENSCLLFVGGGPENEIYESLQALLEKNPESKDRIFLLGFIPDEFLHKMFSLCDIYVSASEMEGFGMSVAQAAIVAKPIVSSNKIPFTSFWLSDEAIIAPAGNVEKFAEGIEFFLTDKNERKSRGKETRTKALGLEWENLTKNFIIDLNKKNFDIPITENITQRLI
jgi:glycosyltransferase involved in cell wall biosynthesis